MSDRFYSQRDGKNGYSKTKIYATGSKVQTKKRRLKADIVKHICSLLSADIPSMDKMTVAGLEELEKAIKAVK